MDDNVRAAMDWALGELKEAENRLYDQSTSTFRWFMAAIFAANGGAVIGLLSDGASELTNREAALIWFAIGVLATLLGGMLSTFASFRGLRKVNAMRLRVFEARMSGLPSSEVISQEMIQFGERMKPTWRTWFPSYALGTAFLAFTGGLVVLASPVLTPNETHSQTEATRPEGRKLNGNLESDVLARTPTSNRKARD